MKQRVLTALAIILVVFPPVFFGGWLLEALAVLIVVTGCYEWLHVLKNFRHWGLLVVPVTVLLVLASRFVPVHLELAYYGIALFFFWALPIFMESYTVHDSQSALMCWVIFTIAYESIVLLIPNHVYLWTLCFATYGSDTFAYLTGRFMGKHKMNPRISPKKTWEGFFGGVAGGIALSWLVSRLYISAINPTLNLALCLLCPMVAEIGDLCFSCVKRAWDIKDFSNLLPGHGGILDRVDSLLANIILFGILYQILL